MPITRENWLLVCESVCWKINKFLGQCTAASPPIQHMKMIQLHRHHTHNERIDRNSRITADVSIPYSQYSRGFHVTYIACRRDANRCDRCTKRIRLTTKCNAANRDIPFRCIWSDAKTLSTCVRILVSAKSVNVCYLRKIRFIANPWFTGRIVCRCGCSHST